MCFHSLLQRILFLLFIIIITIIIILWLTCLSTSVGSERSDFTLCGVQLHIRDSVNECPRMCLCVCTCLCACVSVCTCVRVCVCSQLFLLISLASICCSCDLDAFSTECLLRGLPGVGRDRKSVV